MRHAVWVVLVVALVGCQKQSGAPSVAAPAKSRPFTAEPIPPEIAQLLEKGDHDGALVKIGQMIAARPADSMLYSIRSTIYHRQGYRDQSIADLNKAIELNDQDPRLFNNRGFVLLGVQQFSAAMADFDRATELSPEYPNPFNNRGLLMIARGQYASAIEELDRALRLDPGYVDAYNNRGFAAFQGGNLDRALADFNTAIKLNPNYVNAFSNRGLLRARVGDLDNAIVDFTSAMMLDPLNPKYYEHRCEVYRRQANAEMIVADEAKHDWLLRLQDLSNLIASKPNDVNLLLERARHHLVNEGHSKALDDAQRALAVDAKSLPALLLRGRIYLDRKDFQRALDDANAALSINPAQEAYSLRGDACLGLKDYDQAIESFAAARRLDASVAEAYYAKSEVLQASGKIEAAAEVLKQARSLESSLTLASVSQPQSEEAATDGDGVEEEMKTASTFMAEKDPAKALGLVEYALSVNPKSTRAMLLRAKIRMAQKEYQNALVDVEAALAVADMPDSYSLRGEICLALKEYDKAIQCFDKAIQGYATSRRIDASVSEAYHGKAKALQAMGRSEAATEVLKQASSFDTVITESPLGQHIKAARELLADDLLSDAMNEIQAVLEIDPRSIEALLIRGRVHLGRKEFQKALADADAAIANGMEQTVSVQQGVQIPITRWFGGAGTEQEAYSLRGDACLKLKNYDQAYECYARTRRIDAAVAEAYYRKSQSLKAAGQDKAAAEVLMQATAMDPEVVTRLR